MKRRSFFAALGAARAGVQVGVSGHTHGHAWMPGTEHQPVAQPIGGGPHPSHATLPVGTVTAATLRLEVRKLDGSVAHDVTLPA